MYLTVTELTHQFQQVTIQQLSDDEQTGLLVEDRVEEAITRAGEVLDAYLGNRYTLPLDPVPGVVKKLAGTLALSELYARRPDLETPASVEAERKNAMRMLEQFASGKLSLAGADVQAATNGNASIQTNKTALSSEFVGKLGGVL
jgi:phage gp36-like protein